MRAVISGHLVSDDSEAPGDRSQDLPESYQATIPAVCLFVPAPTTFGIARALPSVCLLLGPSDWDLGVILGLFGRHRLTVL